MKIAVAGKGGAGKTTVAGTLARWYAATGYDVLAIDADDDPNLGGTVGVSPADVPSLPEHFVREADTPEGRIPYELEKSPADVVADHATTGPDCVTILTAGPVAAGSGGFTMYHVTVRLLLTRMDEDDTEVTIVDLPNGYEHFGLGTAIDADVLIGVVVPSTAGLETGRRTIELATQLGIPDVRLVANKVRTERDRNRIETYCTDHDLQIVAVIPEDTAIREADIDGTAPVDADPDSPAVSALVDLAGDIAGDSAVADGHRRDRP